MAYNYATWGLPKSQIEVIYRANRKQFRNLWNDPFKKNRYVYRESMEKPLSLEMKKARWKTFGHMVRLHEKTPCEITMTDYFQIPPNSKRYPGRKSTLPVKIDEDLKEVKRNNNLIVSKFETIEDLQKLRNIAKERSQWTKFSSLICR